MMVLVYTINMKETMEDLSVRETVLLYELYRAECDRDKSEPTLRNFSIWLVEQGYVND